MFIGTQDADVNRAGVWKKSEKCENIKNMEWNCGVNKGWALAAISCALIHAAEGKSVLVQLKEAG